MIRWKSICVCLPILVHTFFVDDSIHHVIEYRMPDESTQILDKEDDQHVVIWTKDNEQYTCTMPDSKKEGATDLDSYTGPTPWEMIAPLKEKNICTQKIDAFWSYELCHGKYIRQYHDSKDERLSFYLGNFHPNYISLSNQESELQKIKVNGEDLPFLPVLYSQGTTCDLTGKPRNTRVLYVCYATSREFIESITEVSTCNYDVVILTQLICSHPKFKRKIANKKKILCTATNPPQSKTDPHPSGFAPLHIRQNREFHKSYSPSDDIVIQPSILDADPPSKGDPALTDLYNKMVDAQGYKKQADLRFDTDGMEAVLSGRICIENGGGEYWKYEYCHLNKITQFHQSDAGQERLELNIGNFNKEKHVQFIQENPSKRPHRFGGKVSQVVHFYSDGKQCGEGDVKELDLYRTTEVRIRCPSRPIDPALSSLPLEDLQFTVSEPSTCTYILTLESERLCQAIQSADHNGLF